MNNNVYFNGKFINEKDAHVSIMTHALHYGTACFEGMRSYYNEKEKTHFIFRLKDHYERLKRSGKLLFMPLPDTVEKLCNITTELVQKNFSETDIYIRPLLYKSGLAVGNFNLAALPTGFLVYTVPLGRYLKTDGIRTNISSWTRVSDTMIPPRAKITGSYVNTALAKTESVLAGYDEALFLDKNGHIVEGSAENIFVVYNKNIYTPPTADDILVGITRDTVTTLCQKELNTTAQEKSIGRSEIYQMDEVFLVGTGAEITPVIEIDERKVGEGKIGPITNKIKELYFDVVHGENNKYSNWVTKVTQ